MEGGDDAVVVALAAVELGDDADPQATQAPLLLSGPHDIGHAAWRVGQTRGVQGVVRGDDVVEQSRVQDGARHGPGRVQG